ncbi:hypothetical protein [Niveispirillum irakense]|uniref:hypothetical protein n=1 Tax=Niveispirillum irakense TaxID=34011 RepID=UPI000403A22A|nr:hypothetical protein [Niveispirillum irakense]
MLMRTALRVRWALIGVLVGPGPMVALARQGGDMPGASGVLVYAFIGALVGALAFGTIGHMQAQNVAPDARMPPLSTARKVVLVICGLVLVASIASIFIGLALM